MPGRRPKPTAAKRAAGNPGKRKLNASEPQPPSGAPEPPSELSPLARVEWERIAPDLLAMGVLSRVDVAALAAYCECYARWWKAEKQVRRHGAVIRTPNGCPIQSPHLGVANKALDQMRKFLIEFGMTPSSRSKVTAQKPDAADPFAEYMNGLITQDAR